MRIAAVIFFLVLPALVWADSLTETRTMSLPANGIDTLVVDCGAGSFNLQETSGQGNIRVAAEIELDEPGQINFEKFLQSNVKLALKKQGNTAVLQSDIVGASALKVEARINLQIDIPQNIDVQITDGSGSIRVNLLHANLKIDDDSGSIKVYDITGEISIEDSSGSIVIEEVTGNVFVSDGSGSIAIESVRGDINVKDGSGSLKIVEIDGNVTVSDSSGSVEIQDVKKNVFVVIREEGSGIVELEGVKGKVTIRP
jgi:hypothetical protein